MRIFLKSRNEKYYAEAEWDGQKDVKIIKGSQISSHMVENFKFTKSVIAARENPSVVDKSFRVLKSVHFRSLTAAAQFVTGRSINGKRCWKNNNNVSLEKAMRG